MHKTHTPFRWLFVKSSHFLAILKKMLHKSRRRRFAAVGIFSMWFSRCILRCATQKKKRPTRLRGCAEISRRSRCERNPASSVSFRRLAARARSSFSRSLRAMFLPAGSRSFLMTSRAWFHFGFSQEACAGAHKYCLRSSSTAPQCTQRHILEKT